MRNTEIIDENPKSESVARDVLKLRLNKNILIKTLSHINGIVEKRNIISILSNVKLTAKSQKLYLTSTDMDMSITESIEAVIEVEGETSVSSQMFYDVIRKINSHEVLIELKKDSGYLKIFAGNSEFNLPVLSADEFPKIDCEDIRNHFFISASKLKFLINKTKFSVSNEEIRFNLSGIHFHKATIAQKHYLFSVTTDGHRLSQAKMEIAEDIEFPGIIVPKKAANEIAKLLEEEGEVKIEYSGQKIKFNFNNIIFITKLIDGPFPDYLKVIPKNNDKILSISREDLAKSVDRVSILSPEKSSQVKFSLSDDNLILSVDNFQYGQARDIIEVNYREEKLEILFNPRYVLDILAAIDDEFIKISFSDAYSPAIVQSDKSDASIYILMPLRK